MKNSKTILLTIVIAQFCCTSLWFAGNSVIQNLMLHFNLESSALGHVTSAVQFGFIIGTLIFAILAIADRFAPSKLFFSCAVFGAMCNAGLIWDGHSLSSILTLRFLTGFFLAGIYPVGMKIASDHYKKGLGKSLGFLVGALVLGTAFPHLLKFITSENIWKQVIVITSALALFGGSIMVLIVPNGPYRAKGQKFEISSFFELFKNQKLRSAALGYFGHMWELYAFWAFVPVMLKTYSVLHPHVSFNIPLLSFFIIGIGSLGCVAGGFISTKVGTKKSAFVALLLSCICCLISPLMFSVGMESIFLLFLLFWGVVVVTDSPLFSTLVAQNASPKIKGTALTLVNCIGFAVTIVSIQLISYLGEISGSNSVYVVLAVGPVLGLVGLKNKG